MGLADRDYMLKRRGPVTPFGPRRRRSGATRTWMIVLIFCAVLGGLYAASDRLLDYRAQRAALQRRAEAATRAAPEPLAPARRALPPSELFPGAPDQAARGPIAYPAPSAASRTVSKCVQAGRGTAYSDGPCASGERASRLEVRRDVNVADGYAIAPEPPTAPAPSLPRVAQAAPQPSVDVSPQDECKLLEDSIAQYDAMARRPQSGQTQDWISERRKEARDRQFRIRCR